MNKTEAHKLIKDKDVKALQLQFINIDGQIQAVEIPVSQLDTITKGEVMIDGSSIKGYASITTSDLFLEPDWSTFMIVDFVDNGGFGKIARLLCFIERKDGKRFEGDPRNILAKIEQKWNKKSYDLTASFELEFFLLKKDANGKYIPGDQSGYFGIEPVDTAAAVKREIAMTLQNHGFEVEAYHKEVAEGQHEINFKYGSALITADRAVTFKWIVRTIAAKHGFIASFMPKPYQGINGSGMHTNISVFKDGKNMFYRKRGEKVNKVHQQFITGLLNRSREIGAISNPTVNSYKRLIPGYEAPNCIAWSDSNRTAMIRVPASFGNSTRIEKRNVDTAANPYLVLSLVFEAGLEGISKNMKPVAPVYDNLFKMSRAQLREAKIELLPDSLGAALDLTSKSAFVKKVLGEHTFTQFIKHKYNEWDEFRQVVHSWEWDKYLNY